MRNQAKLDKLVTYQETILTNQGSITVNQQVLGKVLANQATIVAIQEAILANQDAIMWNHVKLDRVLAKQTTIVNNQARLGKVLVDQQETFGNQKVILAR